MFQDVRSGDLQWIGTTCNAWRETAANPNRNHADAQFVDHEKPDTSWGESIASVMWANREQGETLSGTVTACTGGLPSRATKHGNGVDDSSGVVIGRAGAGAAVGWSQ